MADSRRGAGNVQEEPGHSEVPGSKGVPPQRKGQTHCDGDALKGHRDQQKGLRPPKWGKSEQENIISNYNPNNKINIHEFMIISKINK